MEWRQVDVDVLLHKLQAVNELESQTYQKHADKCVKWCMILVTTLALVVYLIEL